MTHIEDQFKQELGWLCKESELLGEPVTLAYGDQFAVFSVNNDEAAGGVMSCVARPVAEDSILILIRYRSNEAVLSSGEGSFGRGLAEFATESIQAYRETYRK